MPRQGITGVAEYLASKGRNGDDILIHATSGERIVPQEILAKNPELNEKLTNAFRAEQVDPNQYVIGSGIMSINPETNLPEFGWLSKTWKSVKKFVKKAGPVIGTVIGAMIGGPIGATIGAGVGSKTSNLDDRDILKNMALAFTTTNIAAGAGIGGATSSAGAAATTAGGWSAPFTAAKAGIGAFFNPANWTPAAAGQAGIGGFFQNIGSGAARSMGLGGTQTLMDAGLTKIEANQVAAEMAKSGTDAVTAATKLKITNPTTLANLATAGPGISRSLSGAWAGLNPLEQWGVRTTADLALGLHKEEGRGGYGENAMSPPAYLTSNLRSGPAISSPSRSPQEGIRTLPSSFTPPSSVGIGGLNNNRANRTMSKGNLLLDRMADGSFGRADVTSPFPYFEPPTYAAGGGFIGDKRRMFRGGGRITGPGGPRDDLIDAKLSNNEFVMTESAVRGAGNGNINDGARKMYQLMNNLEGRI